MRSGLKARRRNRHESIANGTKILDVRDVSSAHGATSGNVFCHFFLPHLGARPCGALANAARTVFG
jgi:hypothetical protein